MNIISNDIYYILANNRYEYLMRSLIHEVKFNIEGETFTYSMDFFRIYNLRILLLRNSYFLWLQSVADPRFSRSEFKMVGWEI